MRYYHGPLDDLPLSDPAEYKPGDLITIHIGDDTYRMIVSTVDHTRDTVEITGWPEHTCGQPV